MFTEEKIHQQQASTEEKDGEVLTVQEAATFLRLNSKTVYDAISRGELPGARRIGRKIRLSRAALVAWLTQGQGCVPRSTEKKQ